MGQGASPDAKGAMVGLDFGMTNSILTYESEAGPEPYHLPGAQTPAIPTVVSAASANAWDRFIGRLARLSGSFASNFKLLLPHAGSDPHNNAAFKSAATFLETLIKQFCVDQQIAHVDKLVATVPESWLSGRDQGGVDMLRTILKGAGVRDVDFLSEPVAAAAYFAHHYRKKEKSDYDGHVLVYDHGGSTLDCAVVRIKGSYVEVVSSLGNSGTVATGGFGGVAYDRFMLAHVASRYPDSFAGKSEAEKKAWLNAFETHKEEHASRIDGRCANPDVARLRGDLVFDVQGVPITLGDLLETFEAHFQPQILADLDRVLSDALSCEGIALTDVARFRVVTVGGFSQFKPIQQLLHTYFTARCGDEKVLLSGIVGRDRWLAVSKGACLVAASVIDVNQACPFTFGVVSYVGTQAHSHTLMEAGEPIALLRSPRYLEAEFELARFDAAPDARSITLFIENAGSLTQLQMTNEFSAVLPDFGLARSWSLGCQIDNSSVLLAIKSDRGGTTMVRMGRLLRMAEGRISETVEHSVWSRLVGRVARGSKAEWAKGV